MMKLISLSVLAILFSAAMALASDEAIATGAASTTTAETVAATAMPAPTDMTAKTEMKSKTALSESEIPLNVDMNKKSNETAAGSTRIFLTVAILMSIVGVSYYMVRKYKLSNNINKSNTKIKVLSQHYLGPKKSLAIIHVAGESMLIGVTDQNISMIKSLSLIDDEVPADLPHNFSDALNMKPSEVKAATTASAPAGATAGRVTVMAADELEEEFSFSGVKDSVSRKIKSMRSLS